MEPTPRRAARASRLPLGCILTRLARLIRDVMPLNTITMTDPTAIPKLRFGLVLWAAGMVGSVAITAMVLPELLGQVPLPAPLWVISLAGLAQSALLLALAVWAGDRVQPH